MANRFYVKPGMDLGPGLQGLAETVGAEKERQSKEREREEKKELTKQAVRLFREGDSDKIEEFVIANPDFSKTLGSAAKFKHEGTKQNYIDSLYQGLQNPDKIPEIVAKRQAYLTTQGATPEETIHTDTFADKYNQDPEGTLKAIENELIVLDIGRFKKFKSVTGRGEEKSTSDIQNFQHYQTLLKESPEQADLFAQQTGITTSADDKTTAIKEFEYGEKNPKFVLAQKKKNDKSATKETSGKTFENSSKLRKEFLSQSKEYQKVRDSYTRVVGSTQDPSPAGDLSLIFNYMKMLDPGSVVRESEFATAASTGSYGQRIQASAQKVLSGERLAPEMRADFVKKAGVLFNGMQEQHVKRANSYKGIATKNNLPVDEVVVDITAPTEEETQDDRPSTELSDEELMNRAFGGR